MASNRKQISEAGLVSISLLVAAISGAFLYTVL